MSDLIRAIKLEYPETIPVMANILPAAWLKYGDELQKLIDRYPQFFGGHQVDLSRITENLNPFYQLGGCVDEWGCVWSNIDEGVNAIVTGHPIKTEEDVFAMKIPPNRNGMIPHGFMYLRLLDLCGFENAMMMFAEEGEAIRVLIEKVLEYNIYQFAHIIPHLGELASFGDDLGMQNALAIGPEKWRKYMKPCFRILYGMLKSAKPDVLIYMHTDGCIFEIMSDIMDCEVDMINPQFRANGLDNLVRVCRREQIIPINLDLDRQLFPFASRGEIFDHVEECVKSLYLPQGGLGLNIELNYEIPLENMEAIFDAAEKYRFYKG